LKRTASEIVTASNFGTVSAGGVFVAVLLGEPDGSALAFVEQATAAMATVVASRMVRDTRTRRGGVMVMLPRS
jgi:hypothetical protein